MKKVAYLLIISLFSLVGCNKNNTKPVRYQAITNEEFFTYFAEDKQSEALAHFSTIDKVRFTNYQDLKYQGGYMKYTLNRDVDVNYYYEYAKMEDSGSTNVSQSLFIGDSDIDNCHYYEVSSSESAKVYIGSSAVAQYNYGVSNVRNMVTHSIENYLFLTKQYIDLDKITTSNYFLGDDNSIKIISYYVVEGNISSKATTIYDIDTLLVKSFRYDVDNESGKGYISVKFNYDMTFAHKTPRDIGYNGN